MALPSEIGTKYNRWNRIIQTC